MVLGDILTNPAQALNSNCSGLNFANFENSIIKKLKHLFSHRLVCGSILAIPRDIKFNSASSI